MDKKRILGPYGDLDMTMFKEFSEAKGVPGQEKLASRVMKKYLEGYADEIEYDTLGSIIGIKKSKEPDPVKVAFYGHLDEVGFYVKKIEDSGLIKVINAGGFWPHVLLSQEVCITTRDGDELFGMISAPAPHGMPPEEAKKVKEIDDLYVDIGVCDKEEAVAKGVKIGDMVTLVSDFKPLANPNYLMGKAWDDRIGALIATQVLRNLKGVDTKAEVMAVGTVQEEVGLRGAKTAAWKTSPDIGIALDVTLASDVPGSPFGTPLASGVTLGVMDGSVIANKQLLYFMESICEDMGIDYAHDIFLKGGTDSGEIHKTKAGIVNMTLSIPARSIHSQRGIIHRKDVADTITLLTEFCKRVDRELLEKFLASNR